MQVSSKHTDKLKQSRYDKYHKRETSVEGLRRGKGEILLELTREDHEDGRVQMDFESRWISTGQGGWGTILVIQNKEQTYRESEACELYIR